MAVMFIRNPFRIDVMSMCVWNLVRLGVEESRQGLRTSGNNINFNSQALAPPTINPYEQQQQQKQQMEKLISN